MNIVQVYEMFPDRDSCLDHLEKARWHGTPTCPYCKSQNSTPMPKERRHHCNKCNTSYSVTVRTIFHKTKVELQKWFLAVSLILNAKKGISSRQLSRDLHVNKDTGWYMAMRIRRAMIGQRELLEGIVEMDETCLGGKPRKRHGGGHKRGRGASKQPVVGMIERDGLVKAMPARNLDSKALSSLVREHVDVDNATMMTDEYSGYCKLAGLVPHKTVNHKVWYVAGDVHTNSIVSFWALLKGGLVGQFHKVSIRHLSKYIDEFCYRHNHRKDQTVFDGVIANGLGALQ